MYRVPELARLGRAFRSTAETALTETEMEYVVTCIKHVYTSHVVLQFNVLNTIDDQRLVDVCVAVEVSDADGSYVVERVVPASVARYGERAMCFVVLHRQSAVGIAEEGSAELACTLGCELQFRVVAVNPTTGEAESEGDRGYEEVYPLEGVEVSAKDFMAKVAVADFRRAWEQAGPGAEGGSAAGGGVEVMEKFGLPFKKMDEAVSAVLDYLGMQALEGTATVSPDDGNAKKGLHSLHLSGMFVGGVPVLARAMLQLDEKAGGVVLKIAVRSPSARVCRYVADCIN